MTVLHSVRFLKLITPCASQKLGSSSFRPVGQSLTSLKPDQGVKVNLFWLFSGLSGVPVHSYFIYLYKAKKSPLRLALNSVKHCSEVFSCLHLWSRLTKRSMQCAERFLMTKNYNLNMTHKVFWNVYCFEYAAQLQSAVWLFEVWEFCDNILCGRQFQCTWECLIQNRPATTLRQV